MEYTPFKMKGFSGFGNSPLQKDIKDKKALRQSNRKLIQELKDKYKSGDMTKEEFKAAKKEIKGYTDVDAAKDHLNIK